MNVLFFDVNHVLRFKILASEGIGNQLGKLYKMNYIIIGGRKQQTIIIM